MLRVEREGIGSCWEANVGPGAEIKYFSLDGMNCELTSPVTTQAGALHTITITANSEGTQTIDLSNGDGNPGEIIAHDAGNGTYEALVAPQSVASGTAFVSISTTGGKTYVYRMQQDADWDAGVEYKYGISIK